MLPLLVPLLTLTITSCASKPQPVELPPKPQRQEQRTPESIRDYANLIVYYESLVQEWEAWGELASEIVEN